MTRRTPWLLAAISCVLLAACTSTSDGGSPTSAAPTGSTPSSATDTDAGGSSGMLPGYPADVDRFTPLIITTLGPDPIAFTGSDGQVHVTYELQVINASPRPAAITSIDTIEGGPDGEVLATLPQDEIVARTMLVAHYPKDPAPITEVPPGQVALVLLDDIYATRSDVPAEVTHRFDATFGPVPADQVDFAGKFPETVTQVGGPVRTSTELPVVIGAPLSGDDWFDANGCCTLSAHRAGMLPFGGRINGTERYAIDWVQADLTVPGLIDPATGGMATFDGDPTLNESYRAHGEPLLAVADGTVVSVTTDLPEAPPNTILDLGVGQLGGNTVILDIGNGVFAFYAHMVPGSATVVAGDRVTRGQTIGVVGNSGNTTEPHLHFHLMRAPVALGGDNVPFEIEAFTFVGSVDDDGFTRGPDAGPRTSQQPLTGTVMNFPPAP